MTDEIRHLIRERIRQTGLSQADIARQMGLAPQELSRALRERGKIPPIWETILNHFHLQLTVEPQPVPPHRTDPTPD
ncbi:helix-turn-helix transcriptional regulator [Deinococcus sp.]|uniref:helix-turn-helix domain-containing protein n=1 Tax=Deinococcus sp. TaxID=47478 RepID=UPI0025C446DE|nr:helix-turn-helix transcriptional regulator [Deinococcus sp.]